MSARGMRWKRLWTALLAVVMAAGCGSSRDDLHAVTGVVTLDGSPVPNATVSFLPEYGKGRAAVGMTNKRGRYRLRYLKDQSGAKQGKYKVTISTWVPSKPTKGVDAVSIPEIPETIPARYSVGDATTLTATVEEGDNSIDFRLHSSADSDEAD